MEFITVEHPYLGQFTNSFVIKNAERCIFVDTGLKSGCEKLRAICPRPDAVLSTHGHWDHTGCHSLFRKEGVRVLAGEGDIGLLTDMSVQWKTMYTDFQNDFSIPPERKTVFDTETCDSFEPEAIPRDARSIEAGGEEFTLLPIPGHTEGSLFVQHKNSGISYTGDTVCGRGFFGGVPQIEDFPRYMSSLESLRRMDVDTACASHMTGGMSNAVFHRVLEEGLTRCGELWDLSAAYLRETAGSYRIGDMADYLCGKLGLKAKNSGLCVTCAGLVKYYGEVYEAVGRCLNPI